MFRQWKLLSSHCLKFSQTKKFCSASSSYKETKIRVLEHDINYIETLGSLEDAHPIFFIPGAFGSIEMDFTPIMHQFNKEKYKWIAWDPPGYGKSRPPTRSFIPEGYECVYEQDVKYAATLMNILGYKRYTLLSWSAGAITSILMANRQAENISGIIMWGYKFFEPKTIPLIQAMKRVGLDTMIHESRRTQLTKMYGEELFLKMWDGATDEMIKMACSQIYQKGGSFQKFIRNVQCPALVIHGLKDSVVDVSDAKHMNSALKNSRLHLMENGTHNLHLRETKEFVKCIENFIDNHVLNQTQ
ncbi:unnamed protein product [Orchesella dallaii]|uniref:Serine aminopeptidase S33 domain-containing protein n=1 Tax=Orchesella dallaii TaxID=48710 RepID=A0ABP1PJX9_9HEXA